MRKRLFVSILTVVVLFTFSACRHLGKGVQGSGVRKTEKRDLGSFTSIQASGAYEMKVTCQQAGSFEIEGDDNILPLIKTEVRDGVLHILNEKSYNPTTVIMVRIGLADLNRFTSNGAGDVSITNVKNDKLSINSTGATKIKVDGQTRLAEINVPGAAKIDASNLRAERAAVTVTGAAQVDVYASQQLDVTVSGVGQVAYYGNPGVVNKNVTGLGNVTKKESGGN
jgi:hypothetical protein